MTSSLSALIWYITTTLTLIAHNMAECPPRCWYADSLRYPRLRINLTEQSLLLYSLQVEHHRRAMRPWSCQSVSHFSNVNILLIQAPHAASGLVQPLFMVGEKWVIIDKLLPGFNYKAPQVHYTIKKSRFAYYLFFANYSALLSIARSVFKWWST